MIILDTDHIVTLKYSKNERFARLAQRMADSEDQDFVTTAITLEEQMRGWLAQIRRVKEGGDSCLRPVLDTPASHVSSQLSAPSHCAANASLAFRPCLPLGDNARRIYSKSALAKTKNKAVSTEGCTSVSQSRFFKKKVSYANKLASGASLNEDIACYGMLHNDPRPKSGE